MKKGIAFFDFDGTLTTKDTLLEFIKYCKGNNAFYAGFLINSPFLLAYKLKIISNQAAKEKVLQHFFKNTSVDSFGLLCEKFAARNDPGFDQAGSYCRNKKAAGKKAKQSLLCPLPRKTGSRPGLKRCRLN